MLGPTHPLVRLSTKIDWNNVEQRVAVGLKQAGHAAWTRHRTVWQSLELALMEPRVHYQLGSLQSDGFIRDDQVLDYPERDRITAL